MRPLARDRARSTLVRGLSALGLLALAGCGGGGGDSAGAPSASSTPTYTLGGTLSGVTATGLVLAHGSATASIEAGATTFTFATALPTGTTYTVTLQSVPPSLACTLTGASGTIAAANVTTVGVTCQPRSFALGGSVAGLTADGLVLAHGNTTRTLNQGATSFDFGNVLTPGSAYDVTVQSAPAGLTCSVANGSGTTATADVANVVVTCSARAFTLGGTVSGLRTAGLVLGNGSDRLTVPANATTFTLPTAVAWTSSYDVTVVTQPTGASCAVVGGASTMQAANVTSVTINCSDQPYTLGGTITGLTTSGLVLANGSDTLAVAANATTFTMPTAVAYDRPYALTVQTQPTGLTCSIANGAGTMPAANVANVAITCAARSYTLGGSVSGLATTGLVLANGSDTVNVPANATQFTLPTPVAFGSAYAVTVQAQPAGRTCSVASGTGTMPASAVNAVAVTCSANFYSVGGSITGLTATGLVLANGSNTLNVASNATQFTMPSGVASGSSYTISVQTHPTGLFCSLANASGTVTSADVTNVQVSCVASQYTFLTPGAASWVVPAGVTSIQVVATGGGGGGVGGGPAGGHGGVVTATRAVTPGETLALFVGGGGAGGFGFSGAGGGATNVDAGGPLAIIAGGGGGAGDFGAGGNGGGSGTGAGGNGSGATGGIGGSGGFGGSGPLRVAGGNGRGGAGGLGSVGAGGVGAGSGTGGSAAFGGQDGGGGGGGYGGGSSGTQVIMGIVSGGGGGGSLGPAGTVYSVSTNGGASNASGGSGSIVITIVP